MLTRHEGEGRRTPPELSVLRMHARVPLAVNCTRGAIGIGPFKKDDPAFTVCTTTSDWHFFRERWLASKGFLDETFCAQRTNDFTVNSVLVFLDGLTTI
jgi:hypothetical protein